MLGALGAAAAIQLLLCGAYSVMAESLIEDFIKSGLVLLCGGLLLRHLPLVALAAMSAAVLGIVVNQSFRKAWSGQKS